jgi:hypothetical protein
MKNEMAGLCEGVEGLVMWCDATIIGMLCLLR